MFKKRLLIIPLVVITAFIQCFCFTANAEAVIDVTYTGMPDYYYDKDELAMALSNQRNVTSDQYFFLKVCNTEPFASDQWRSFYSSYYIFPDVGSEITASESGGVYTFNSTLNFQMFSGGTLCYFKYSDPEYRDLRSKGTTQNYESLSTSCKTLIFDSNNHTVTLTNGNGDKELCYGSLHNEILEVDFDLGDLTYNPDAMNVSVEFHPELSGSIDRSETLPSGVVTYQDLFNFNVINNSNKGIQWYMAIVEEGYNIMFHQPAGIADSGEYGADITEYSPSIKYIYLHTEDVYLLKNSAFYMDGHVQSSLHQVAAHSESGLNLVKWDMVNLEKDKNYDVVVYAMFNNADKASFVYGLTLYNQWVAQPPEFDNIQEVYRSTFSLTNPASYNPNSKIGGAIANDSDSDINGITKNLVGYSDYDDDGNPTTVWGNYTYGRDIGPSYNGSYYSSGSSGSAGRFGQLMSLTSGAFGFFAAVLKLFPSSIYQVFILGFTALIIVAIIKKVT